MEDFATLIARWPSPSIRTFADDLGVAYVTAQMWKHRNSVPVEHWDRVIGAANKRGIDGITLEALQRLAVRRRRRVRGNDQAAVAA